MLQVQILLIIFSTMKRIKSIYISIYNDYTTNKSLRESTINLFLYFGNSYLTFYIKMWNNES